MKFDYTFHWDRSGDWCPTATTIDLEGYGPEDVLAKHIRMLRTFWETDLLEDLGARGPLGGVFLDVGANIGNHAVYFAKFLADLVVAIEPNAAVLPLLERNLRCNGVANCHVLTCAIGAVDGRGRLVDPEDGPPNISAVHIELSSEEESGDTVPITTLDAVLMGLGPVVASRPITLMKLDIEGMEMDALQGAISILEDHRPQLLVEAVTPEARSVVEAFLGRFNYLNVGQYGIPPTYWFIDPARHHLRKERSVLPELVVRRAALAVEEMDRLIPPGEAFVLLEEGGWPEDVLLPGRQRVPFLHWEGSYWGPPADDTDAITEVERLREGGVSFIVFTWFAFWWLDYYSGLHQHLRANSNCVLENDRLVVFELGDRV